MTTYYILKHVRFTLYGALDYETLCSAVCQILDILYISL